jgi:ABC-type lipopolysaccharide export system ATPase subunit
MAVNPKLRYTSTTKSTKKTTPTATTKPSPKKAAESQNMGQGYWKDNKGRVYKADASTKWARQYVQNKPGNSYTQRNKLIRHLISKKNRSLRSTAANVTMRSKVCKVKKDKLLNNFTVKKIRQML